jgi:hypothetical protein
MTTRVVRGGRIYVTDIETGRQYRIGSPEYSQIVTKNKSLSNLMEQGYTQDTAIKMIKSKNDLALQALNQANTTPQVSTPQVSTPQPTTPKVSTPQVSTTGNMTSTGKALYDTAANRLTNTYNDVIGKTTDQLNKRGMFGSGIANRDIGKVNQNLAMSLSDLSGNIAGQEAGFNTQNVQNYATLQSLGMQQQQVDNQRMNALLSLFS